MKKNERKEKKKRKEAGKRVLQKEVKCETKGGQKRKRK